MNVIIDHVAWPERFTGELNAIWRPGDTVRILGPTGSGKSSFLDLLSGFARPSSGTVDFHGTHGQFRITPGRINLEIYKMAARVSGMGVGRLFQDDQRFDSITVNETLSLAERSACLCSGVGPRIIQDLLGFAGISSKKRMGELSYGQTRIVALASAFIIGKHVLILDEPAAGLHQGICEYLREFLTAIAVAGVLVVAAEHENGLLASPTCTHFIR